jgi:hypothetical protein
VAAKPGAQASDVALERAARRLRAAAPTASKQLVLRDDVPGRGRQAQEQRVLALRQGQLDAVETNDPGGNIERERADGDRTGAAARERAHARTQLGRPQTTGEHDIRAGVEGGGDLRAAGADDNQRGRRIAGAQRRQLADLRRDDQRTVRLVCERPLELVAQRRVEGEQPQSPRINRWLRA